MNGRSYDALISNTDISPLFSFFIDGKNGFSFRWWYCSDNYRTTLYMISIKLYTGLWLAKFIGSLVHHEDFFFRTNTRKMSVIPHSYQQSSPIRIGKGRYGFGKFTGILYPILEILLLVFTLADKPRRYRLSSMIAFFCAKIGRIIVNHKQFER